MWAPPPPTVRGVMGMEERAREPSVGTRVEGVEELAPLGDLEGWDWERRERNWELFIVAGVGDLVGWWGE